MFFIILNDTNHLISVDFILLVAAAVFAEMFLLWHAVPLSLNYANQFVEFLLH